MNAGDVPTYICTYIIGRRYKVRTQAREKKVKNTKYFGPEPEPEPTDFARSRA